MIKFKDYLSTISSNSSNLNFSNHSLGNNPILIIDLSEFLKFNPNIKSLNLSNNNLGSSSENIKILYDGLKNNTSIEEIDLSNNNLGINEQNKNNRVNDFTFDNETQRMIDTFLWLCEIINDCISLKKLNLKDNLFMDPLWMGIIKEKFHEKNNFHNQNIQDYLLIDEESIEYSEIFYPELNHQFTFANTNINFYLRILSF